MEPIFTKKLIIRSCVAIDYTNLPKHTLSDIKSGDTIHCAQCKREATHVVQWKHKNEKSGHFNKDFFHLNPKTGSMTLMTKDHILPRCYAGADAPSNYRVLCGPCNFRRGHEVENHEWLEIMKDVPKYTAAYRKPTLHHPLVGWLEILRQFPQLSQSVRFS